MLFRSEDINSCVEFIEGYNCIINCSRYSDSAIFNLIDTVNKNRCILIDLSYYDFYEKIAFGGGTIYHGVGSSPGLMESLPIIISKIFDKTHSFQILRRRDGWPALRPRGPRSHGGP